jgi:cysteine desulfurase
MRPAHPANPIADEPRVYLDNNATTRVDPAVVAAMLPFFSEHYGNASSLHGFGATVAKAVTQARRQVQALLGAASDQEILFTASGTEADSTAILSALQAEPGRDEIVTSAVEHPAILALCQHLTKTRNTVVHVVPVDASGQLDIDAYRRVLGPRTAVASVMWANNETGTIFPLAELAALAHAAGALFHSDAVQAAGKLAIDVQTADIDMLSVSGHKLHAPKGIGALYVRRGVKFTPLLRGGGQERGRRAGTENVPGIVGLGQAAELALTDLTISAPRLAALRDRLEQGVLNAIDDVLVIGDQQHRLSNTSNLAFTHANSDGILTLLDRAGIACSSGSACKSGMQGPSHVLRAMQVPFAAAHGAIRFSLSRETTAADIDRLLAVLPGIVARLRQKPGAQAAPAALALHHA